MTDTILVTKATCPAVPGKVLLTDAARMLGVSRQYVHRLADMGRFATLEHLGEGTVYVVATAEVDQMVSSKAVKEEEHADAEAAESHDVY